jgi:hypothetical protein
MRGRTLGLTGLASRSRDARLLTWPAGAGLILFTIAATLIAHGF